MAVSPTEISLSPHFLKGSRLLSSVVLPTTTDPLPVRDLLECAVCLDLEHGVTGLAHTEMATQKAAHVGLDPTLREVDMVGEVYKVGRRDDRVFDVALPGADQGHWS